MSNFNENEYMIRRKILKLFGGAFHIYDGSGRVVGYTKMKAFKLKEDLCMFDGEDMRNPIFSIKARNVIDFSATYDVFDGSSGHKIGALRRKGLKSILKDEWIIMDANDAELGLIAEDSAALALVRRFLTNLIPQSFDCTVGGQRVCHFKQNFNPFVMKINVKFNGGPAVDRNLLMAGGVLLCAIEGRQG